MQRRGRRPALEALGRAGRHRGLTLLGALWLVVPTWEAAATEPALDPFAGSWVRTEIARDDAARDAEIVRVTEAMSWAIRGIARAVMRSRMDPPARFTIEAGPAAAAIRADEEAWHPIDGETHERDGATSTTRLREDGAIHQVWRHDAENHGTTTWRLTEGGGRLRVTVWAKNAQLDEPMEYSHTYRRAADPDDAVGD